MKICAFTIRNKDNGELIYAEGCVHSEYVSDFQLEPKWFGATDHLSASWTQVGNYYYFNSEVRFLINYTFEKIVFKIEEFEVN